MSTNNKTSSSTANSQPQQQPPQPQQKVSFAYVNNNSNNKQPSHSSHPQPQQQQQQQSQHQQQTQPHHSSSNQAHPSQLPQLQLQQKYSTNNNNNNNSGSSSSSSTQSQPSQSQKPHSLPPRYQPPPQPPGSILKRNISPSKSGIPTFSHHSPPGPSNQHPSHLNIKYPPDVPKLTTVYIPDGVRNTSRIATARSLQPTRQSINTVVQAQLHQQQQHQQQQQQHQQQQQQPSPQSRLSSGDEEQHHPQPGRLQAQPQQEMLKFVRKSDTESVASSSSGNVHPSTSNNVIRMPANEQNRHFQSLIAELRTLKEQNQRLSDDNQELRDLCCFLDDDRQKGRKLAREWQRFGRYTASVMRQEVSAYQNKLRQLDDKQQELIRDNLELKELCLYLDEERANAAAAMPTSCTNCGAPVRPPATSSTGAPLRDDGDGSSSSTNDEPMPSARHFDRTIPELQIRSTLNDQTLQYVRSLERRIMEQEMANSSAANNTASGDAQSSGATNAANSSGANTANVNTSTSSSEIFSGRPEAVVRALQILEVREQLERDRAGNSSISPEQMDDGEKALLREMCNVVWRKLEENPNGPSIEPL